MQFSSGVRSKHQMKLKIQQGGHSMSTNDGFSSANHIGNGYCCVYKEMRRPATSTRMDEIIVVMFSYVYFF